MKKIPVNHPGGEYSIHIESGVLARLGELVTNVAPHGKCLLVVDDKIVATHGAIAIQSLEQAGYEIAIHEIKASEEEKTLESVRGIYDTMLRGKLERTSPVIALGGGIVGDTAGFAAATYLRGVPLVQVPTTLLAMVDASIGGKTGVNHPLPGGSAGEGNLGKNLIGAFWQPKAVIVDPQTLMTLEPRDFRCGLAECVKHGMIADSGLLTYLDEQAEPILNLDDDILVDLIERSASVKVSIVQEDEREAGRRALLNLGHTFAHALESFPQHHLTHGDAVSLGLELAMKCAFRTGRVEGDDVLAMTALRTKLHLPSAMKQHVSIDRLMEAMTYDKKVVDGRIHLVLPRGLGAAEIVDDVEPGMIRDVWATIFAEIVPDGPDDPQTA